MTMLNLRTADAGRHRDARTMTCDSPVRLGRVPRVGVPAAAMCQPSGRSPYPRGGAVRPERTGSEQWRAPSRRPVAAGPERENVSGRQIWLASALTGTGLALLVLLFGLIGSDYQNAVTQTPAQTQVVHVRSGESLSALAARIAPQQPAAAVIATVRALNDLQSSALRPGQALIAPAYR